MREIKFRCWMKKADKWYPHNDLKWFPLRSLVNEDNCSKNLIFNQYTGLKDKNGKEIYELMEINNKYRVEYIPPKYILTNISNCDILLFEEVIKNENTIEITKEYTEI